MPQDHANVRTESYISVDIETSGPVPSIYNMLSLGACLVGEHVSTFYAELRPVTDQALPEALNVSGFTLDQLAHTGRDPQEVMEAFRDWVQEVASEATPVFVGFNASFDWSFVNWYFHTFLDENPFGIGALDIKAYYMGLSGCQWRETTSSQMPQQFQPSHQATHNALDDAIAQAQIFEKLLEAAQRTTNHKDS
jgi:DNA polymerase III alpha subunit (gram-positive type)